MNRLILILCFIFVFFIFYEALKNSNLYEPYNDRDKNIPIFKAKLLYEDELITSENIFSEKKFYLLNIWASWCVPCRDEHSLLMNLKKNDKLIIIGLNYKDKSKNAKKFINDLGNPYSKILIDTDGTKAIEWGAYGVPETFLIFDNQILKKYIGPLDADRLLEIKSFIK